MTILSANDLRKQYGPRHILDGASLTLDEGEKIGIIGVNGSGKSTLLRILSGQDHSEGGTIALKRGAAVGYLPQDPPLDPTHTIRQEMEQAIAEHRQALHAWAGLTNRLAELGVGENSADLLRQLDQVQHRIEHLGGFDLTHRIEQVLTPLGIVDLDRPILGLSGGQKKRVAIGKVLLQRPDLLLLDEPTNHLDADTVQWLEQELAMLPGALLLITHDRYFLDRVVTRMIEVREGKLVSYPGGYEAYLSARADELALAERAETRRQNLMRVELEWLRRGPKARTTKSQARIDRAEAMMDVKGPSRPAGPRLDFGESLRQGKTILRLEHIAKAYGPQVLFQDLNLDLTRGERIGILGPNGAGKTTLLKLIVGEVTPDSGVLTHGQNTVILYFDQTREALDPEKTIRDEVADQGDWVETAGKRVHIASWLEDFLFPPGSHITPIKALSGGERNRVLLAKLMKRRCNLLILDEPTNDLDLLTLQVLEAAISRFDGCVLTVTHDRYFLNRIATAILAFEGNGKVIKYEGDYDTWRALKAQTDEREQATTRAKQEAEAARARKLSPPPPESPRKKRLTWAEERELERLPGQIESSEAELASLHERLSDPELYTRPQLARETQARLAELEANIAHLYQRWEILEEKRS